MSKHELHDLESANRSALIRLASPYGDNPKEQPVKVWANILGDVFVLNIGTLYGPDTSLHLTRDGLTDLWEMLADLDASTPTQTYDGTRDV
jgi:hypothetical protein